MSEELQVDMQSLRSQIIMATGLIQSLQAEVSELSAQVQDMQSQLTQTQIDLDTKIEQTRSMIP